MNRRPHRAGELFVAYYGKKPTAYGGVGMETNSESDERIKEVDRSFSRNHRGHWSCNDMEKLGFDGSFGVVLTYDYRADELKGKVGMVLEYAILENCRYYRMLFVDKIYWLHEDNLSKVSKRMQKSIDKAKK